MLYEFNDRAARIVKKRTGVKRQIITKTKRKPNKKTTRVIRFLFNQDRLKLPTGGFLQFCLFRGGIIRVNKRRRRTRIAFYR